jgi:hypothetical protein
MDPAWRWAGKTVTNTRTSCAGSAGARLGIWPDIFLHHKRVSEHLEPDEEMLTAVDDQMLPEMAEAWLYRWHGWNSPANWSSPQQEGNGSSVASRQTRAAAAMLSYGWSERPARSSVWQPDPDAGRGDRCVRHLPGR